MTDPEFEKISGQVIKRARNYGPKVEKAANEAVSRAKKLFQLTPDEVEAKFRNQIELAEKEGSI